MELLVEVFRAQDGYLHEEEFTGYATSFCVIQDGPYRDLRTRSVGT